MRVFHVTVAVLLAGLGAATPAGAQSFDEQIRQCNEADGAVRIGGCTALIESGRFAGPALAAVYINRGIGRHEQNDLSGARADYDQAIRLAPDDTRPYALRGILRESQNDLTGARSDYDQAIRLDPNRPETYRRRAILRERQNDWAGAAGDARQAARLAPGNADAHNSVCWNMTLAGEDLDRARAACDTALQLAPNNANYLDSRGLVGLKQRRYGDAWADYDAAMRLDARSARYRYGRGLAALGLGRRASGEADIAAATAQDRDVAREYRSYGLTP